MHNSPARRYDSICNFSTHCKFYHCYFWNHSTFAVSTFQDFQRRRQHPWIRVFKCKIGLSSICLRFKALRLKLLGYPLFFLSFFWQPCHMTGPTPIGSRNESLSDIFLNHVAISNKAFTCNLNCNNIFICCGITLKY